MKLFSAIDWGLFAPVVVLLLFSVTTLLSISPFYFQTQLLYIAISFVVFLFTLQVSFRFLSQYSLTIYVASLVLLGFVLILGIESRGAVRWIEFFGLRIQFSEIFKPLLAVSFAMFLGHRSPSGMVFFASLLFLAPVFLFIALQPDLGNALLYAIVVFFTLVVYGISWIWLAGFFGFFALSFPIVWQFLRDYQQERILTFLHPANDPLGTSYNAVQSMVAVGSGMFFGKGFGAGTQSVLRFLPERQTDFIFATLSESFGLVGSIIVVISMVFLLWRILQIVQGLDDTSERLFCIIVFFLFFIQAFVNIGMNVGLVPVVGVTLPFVSYGGSSLLSNFILLGLLTSVAREVRRHEILAIR